MRAPLLHTHWTGVAVLIAAGWLAACQVGKAAIAAPLFQRDLGLALVTAGWIVGAYGTLAAFAGLPAGAAVARLGARRAVIVGLVAIALGSTLGAFAGTAGTLLACRILEGCGFLAIVIGVPTLLRSLAADRDRGTVFGLWSSYMPGGSALMMLAGPALTPYGWQALWLVNGVAALAFAGVVLATTRDEHDDGGMGSTADAPRLLGVLAAPGPRLLAITFGFYSFQYFALTGLLPFLLVERRGLTLAQAGAISAATVVANTVGNLVAGLLARFSVPLWAIVATAFAFMGVASFGVFADGMPVVLVAVLAASSLGITGLVPSSIFMATPRLAPQAALLALTVGLVTQASNIGQVLGPVVLAFWAQAAGWSNAPALFAAVAVLGLVLAAQLRRLLRSPDR